MRNPRRVHLLVDAEDAVGVTVEGEADVGTGLEHAGLEVPEVLDVDRVGLVVREGAVELGVHHLEVEGQLGEHGRHDMPPMPLAVSAMTFSGFSFEVSMNDKTWSTKAEEMVGAERAGGAAASSTWRPRGSG